MPHVDKHAPGAFAWIELSTTSQDAAKAFYSSLFGWSIIDNPMGPAGVYTIFQLEGRDVAACYTQDKAEAAMGAPPHWNLYIAADSADETTAKAKENGATVLAGPFDVMSHGRMSVVMDPTGAAFCVWEAKDNPGIRIHNQTGSLCWADLGTKDQAKAADFYKSVFGYTMFLGQEGYVHIQNGETMIGGIQNPTHRPDHAPAAWLIYILVDDCEASTAKATELGGSLLVPTMPVEGVGKMSVVRDPAGAVFALFEAGPRSA